jgi:hypothetical protein
VGRLSIRHAHPSTRKISPIIFSTPFDTPRDGVASSPTRRFAQRRSSLDKSTSDPNMHQISEARLAANRENAKKSTGPKTEAGKQRSRQNSVKHGLTAGVLIAEELKELAEERVKSWTRSMKPQTAPEAWLVERAAIDAARVDAASRCERAKTEARLRYDILYSKGEGISESGAAKQGSALMHSHPSEAADLLIHLRAKRSGCEWLLRRWADLKRRHQAQGCWEPYEFFEAQRLTGMSYTDEVVTPVCARVAVEFMLSSPDGLESNQEIARALNRARWSIEAMSGPDFPPGAPETIARANQRLADFTDARIEELEERLESLLEVEDLDDSLAAERMLVDLSAEGKLLHRYETELVRRVHHSLDLLSRIRKSIPESQPEESTQPEPVRSEIDAQAPQLFVKSPRNEPNSPDSPDSTDAATCESLVPEAPQPCEKPARNEPMPPAVSVNPTMPPSPILAALDETPRGGLLAQRDILMARAAVHPPFEFPTRKIRRKRA